MLSRKLSEAFWRKFFSEGRGNGVVSRGNKNGAIVFLTLCFCSLTLPSSPSLPHKSMKSWEWAAVKARETTINPGGSSYREAQQTSCLHSCKAPLQRAAILDKPRRPCAPVSGTHGPLEKGCKTAVLVFHPPSFWQLSLLKHLVHQNCRVFFSFNFFIVINRSILHAFVWSLLNPFKYLAFTILSELHNLTMPCLEKTFPVACALNLMTSLCESQIVNNHSLFITLILCLIL